MVNRNSTIVIGYRILAFVIGHSFVIDNVTIAMWLIDQYTFMLI